MTNHGVKPSMSREEATRHVELWVTNDYAVYPTALALAEKKALPSLCRYLTRELKQAEKYSAAWYTAQDMNTADYRQVEWSEIADSLTAE